LTEDIVADGVFINYRRALNLTNAQLLQKALQRHFGRRDVFLDVSGLDGGDHWLHTLERQVDASAAMVVLIGRGWADVTDEKGTRRLDNPNDFVRFELARAFSRNIPVLPVLIDGAELPDVSRLPTNLLPLTFPQAMLLRSESFDDDAGKIARRLRSLIAQSRPRGVSYLVAGAGMAAALAAGIAAGSMLLSRPFSGNEQLRVALDSERNDLAKATRERDGLRAELAASQTKLGAAEKAREAALAEVKRAKADAERAEARRKEESVRSAAALAEAKADAEAWRQRHAETDKALIDMKAQRADLVVPTPEPVFRRPSIAPLTAAAERALKPKDIFTECPECPEMVVMPKGTFTMGSPDDEAERSTSEHPRRRVTIAKAFAVGRFEVTFAEWEACVSAGKCSHKPGDEGWDRGKRPVINVSWNDITQQYLPWLSQRTGKTYRLLTEAEWEYVTRAGTETPYWWGSSISTSQANYDASSAPEDCPKGKYPGGKTVPVDSFAPNPWGLYNVHGNVWEWVEDSWHRNYLGAPRDGSVWTEGDASFRVIRGGSWGTISASLRSACRGRIPPTSRDSSVGFRVARTLAP
jgi:formylglycine-generating enzyme required for sulfatase activity